MKLVIGMVEDKINESKNSTHGYIFDGFLVQQLRPRHWIKCWLFHGLSISGMIALDVPEDILKARIIERGKTSKSGG